MTEPQEPDLDGVPRAELAKYDRKYADVAEVLDTWLRTQHGVISSHHGVGAFLDELAAIGYRVEPIDNPLPALAD